MGDRGNIVMKDGDQEVFFYAHWRGGDLLKIVQRALAKTERWNDPPYLSRIVFCELVKGYEQEEAGFGISCNRFDNNHDDVVVDVQNGTVYTRRPDDSERLTSEAYAFLAFITLNLAEAFPSY